MDDYRDYAARRLRPEERRGIMHMDMLSRSFRLAACDLSKRLEGYRYLNRDLGAVESACRRMIEYAAQGTDRGALGCGYVGCQLSNDGSKINRQEKI